MAAADASDSVSLLFTDIEGSTRLWEQAPDDMKRALARHDELARSAIDARRGTIVKMTGDGVYAAFPDSLDAVGAALDLQLAVADPQATHGIPLRVRCGVHAGIVERRDNDLFGGPVSRAARIMSAAHGGQVLISQVVANQVRDRLPHPMALRDLGVVRLRDLASPEHVHQLVHPALRHDFPVLRSLEATPNNLPRQLGQFVGREREQAELRTLLGSSRLLTVVGAGGLGKTRLALQVAANALDDFSDGVWLVELAPLADGRWVPQAVASVLGVREEPGRPLMDALKAHVKDRKLLLVLDNCEHLLDASARLARDLLQAGPGARVLTSSRERLRVAGETTFAVSTLSVPDASPAPTAAAILKSEAVRLFASVAAAVQPGFQVSDQNAGAVSAICRRLDGIPLAIELAAARVGAIAVERIAERLDDRFRLLSSGDRTALPRQQTLRACFDWSHTLLDDPERTLFRRLAAFSGDWSLDAAEAVAAGGPVNAPDVLELVTRLVDKSLVERPAEGQRYRQLETIRQYAEERLVEAGEHDIVRTRHLHYIVSLVREGRERFHGPAPGAWFARLDLERENLLAAHAWCDRAAEGASLGLKLVAALEHYWSFSGLLELGQRVTSEALARTGSERLSADRGAALTAAGNLSFWLGSYADAQRLGEESVKVAREIGDKGLLVLALVLAGWASHARRHVGAARRYGEEAVALAREGGDKRYLDLALNNLAEFHRAESDLAAAEPLYQEALAIARAWDDHGNVAINLFNLAMVSIGRGAPDRAPSMLLEALSIVEESGSKRKGVAVLEVASGLAAAVGEWPRAALLFGAAEAQLYEMGIRREPVDEAALTPLLARAREALGPEAFAAKEGEGRSLEFANALAEVRSWLTQRFALPPLRSRAE